MKRTPRWLARAGLCAIGFSATLTTAVLCQEGAPPGFGGPGFRPQGREGFEGGPRFGGPGFGGPGFGGPMGGPMGGTREVLSQFDKNGDGWLNKEERAEAREFLKTQGPRGGFGGRGPGGGRGPEGRGPGAPGPGGPVPEGPGIGPGGAPPGGEGPGFGGPGFGGPFGGRPGFGGGGPGRSQVAGTPGPKVSPEDVQSYPEAPLYSDSVVRTLFLSFEENDWEEQLADFNNTDVDIPAMLRVDGKEYPNVGVHFRGMSSFAMVPAGSKRSLNLSMDFIDSEQRLYGRKTLNLLNSHEDPSFLRTVLYLEAAQKFTLAPVANFVHVVINGESWGLYVNAEQFNKEFVETRFESSKGARWKVPGRPGGRGGLEYLGDNIEDYKRTYDIRTKDSKESWRALVELCKILNTTAPEELPEKIEPILAVDEVLGFLALDIALINADGYWTRASDYSLIRDEKGVFHVAVHDANETFSTGGGPGFGGRGGPGGPGGPGGRRGPEGGAAPGDDQGRPGGQGAPGGPGGPGGFGGMRGSGMGPPGPNGPFGPGGPGGPFGGGARLELDPLSGLDDATKPLRSKLLAVPKYRQRYLEIVAKINDEILGGDYLKSRIAHYAPLIDSYVEKDTRKLSTYEAFQKSTSLTPTGNTAGRETPLIDFAKGRNAYLTKFLESQKSQ